ncbi:hypothetical protein A2982_00295 [candidate division WWE3 bacterium RIFCSPLOWO2_01_FULL_39_13]|uniref:HIT domain-containing protein n=1 Tax=candidate division WWE3 bacterium RIFCSPLOWO2_01_FULL_39_13 TaxID=1802624 RepID=A0A1F4V4B7_UNCKA|nr:MAG: hypothetical protein A2982_00295 [candidate division WWE3 bacterium RIFCSPLOWO2_01_FULL_39_13]
MDCIFCDIAEKKARAKIAYEDDEFIAFENINPQAPVHLLVMPKSHFSKRDMITGSFENFWDKMMLVVQKILKMKELDKTGYRLVINGAGYNIIDHEHIHILGGKGWRPADDL